jgi:hypothetical protein
MQAMETPASEQKSLQETGLLKTVKASFYCLLSSRFEASVADCFLCGMKRPRQRHPGAINRASLMGLV